VAGCNFIACMHHAHPATFLHVRRLASRMLTIFSAVCATKRYFCGPGKHVYIEARLVIIMVVIRRFTINNC